MGRLEGKVALVTGAARGQGRSHAVRMAQEGADLLLLDVLADLKSLPYGLACEADMEATVSAVRAAGREVIWATADVRDEGAVADLVNQGISRFGRLDVVSANAGVTPRLALLWEITREEWDDVIGVNLTGVFTALRCSVPAMIEAGNGGAIVLTSSGAGLAGVPHLAGYNASKHGVVGLAKTLANELAGYDIRVNALCPGSVGTDMITSNLSQLRFFRPDLEEPTLEDALPVFRRVSPLGREWIEPSDVTNALLFLVSDEGRYITGIALPVDQGTANRA